MRIAFVGQQAFVAACAFDRPVDGIEPRLIDFHWGADGGALRSELEAFKPAVVVVFRPDIIPAGLFYGLAAMTLGFLTEPLPRTCSGAVDGANFDRIVAVDPLVAESTAEAGLEVWRSAPLPVADRFYGDVRPQRGRPRVLFSGRRTPHRERMLALVERHFDVFHLPFGATEDELERLLGEHEVGLNIHEAPYPSYEHPVSIFLAAGLLVISEPLSPEHGLEPELDYRVCGEPHEIVTMLELAAEYPGIFDRIRIRGRLKAESFRASRAWPWLLTDLAADVAAFGRRST